MSDFAIYALPLSGGQIALSPLPGRSGDYRADLQHLNAWQPCMVISMTTQHEMDARDAAQLGFEVQIAGARWAHVPIIDFGAPSPKDERPWRSAASAALKAIEGGGRVLIHCNGGCGRSGMAVLRLMVMAGEEPQGALARLRSVRPCAVETDEQMQWAIHRPT